MTGRVISVDPPPTHGIQIIKSAPIYREIFQASLSSFNTCNNYQERKIGGVTLKRKHIFFLIFRSNKNFFHGFVKIL